MNKIIIVLAVIFLSACATKPVPTELANEVPFERLLTEDFFQEKDNSGKVIIKRDSGFAGSACSSRIFVNSKPLADIWPKEKVTMYLEQGRHIFSSWPNGICGGGLSEFSLIVENNKVYFLRVGYGSNGDYYIVPTAF